MLLLLCFFCVLWSYASESLPLLPKNGSSIQVICSNNEGQNSSNFVTKIYTYNSFPSITIEKIKFYDPINEKEFSFTPITDITNLFNEENTLFFDTISSEKMNTFLKKNNLNQDLFNKFITFFKQIEHWYTYASIPKNIWHEQWTDHLKHFFYTIISLENPSNEKTIYNHFFSCFEKEAENLYSDISKTRKNLILVGVPSITISLGGLFTFYAWVQTDLEPENLKNSFGGIFCLTSAVLLPTTAASIAVGGYLLNCFGYKKFLKNIKTIDV